MDMTAYFMGRLAETSIPPGGLNLNIVEPAINETFEDTDIYNANGMNVVINGILEMIDGMMPTLSDLVAESISDCERTYNKTKYIDINSGENLYPDAKAVYEYGQRIAQSKQDTLVNGSNIKTINGKSILGSGDLSIVGGGSSSGEEWVELLKATLEEDTAYVDLVAEDDKKFKKVHIFISTETAGLSAASKILIKGSKNASFGGSNSDSLTITSGTVNTWGYPTFIIEKGKLFPIAFSTIGAINGTSCAAVHMGGIGQNHSQNTDLRYINNGPWKIIRIQPNTVDVVFKAGVKIYVWGVYE